MAKVEIKSNLKLGLAEILEGVAKLGVDDLELFMKEISHILEKKKKDQTKSQEAQLIKKIKTTYPPELKNKFQSLQSKMEEDALSEKEEKELIELSDKFEAMDTQRLQYLLELAKIKGEKLSVILKKFPSPTTYA